jgi:hypothetical protein
MKRLDQKSENISHEKWAKRYGILREVRVHYLIFYFMTPVRRVSTLQITYCPHFKGVKTEAADSSKT